MVNLVKRFVREEEGATMVEYGVMVALIAVVCIVTIGILGGLINGAFDEVNDELGVQGVAVAD